MSTWDVKLNSRKETIVVVKVVQKWKKFPIGFPGIEIIDQHGKTHILAYLDFLCSMENWNQIKEGTKIVLTIKEFVTNPRVLLE